MEIQKANNKAKIIELLRSEKDILIFPHIMADGDTIGSSIALYLGLKRMGKNPLVVLDEDIPYNLQFLLFDKCIAKNLEKGFFSDLVVTIDCSDIERIGERSIYLQKAKYSVNIDHHITNTYFADYNLVDTSAAATGEIIYRVIKDLSISIDKEIATCLYSAISTDTGSFKYDNTTSITHKIVAELLDYAIDLNYITTELYQNKPIYKIKLLAEVLNTLELYYSGKLGILHLTNNMLEKVGAKISDADGLIEFVRDIEGVEVGVLLKELTANETKVGFRSKSDIDVGKIAKNFGGGGHKKASGCTIMDNVENAKKYIVDMMKKYFR